MHLCSYAFVCNICSCNSGVFQPSQLATTSTKGSLPKQSILVSLHCKAGLKVLLLCIFGNSARQTKASAPWIGKIIEKLQQKAASDG